MMEPESVPAGPEEEPGVDEARQEDAAPADSSPPAAPEPPVAAVPDPDPVPPPAPVVPPPPPDTPRWAESAALTEIQPPAPVPPVEVAPAVEAAPEPPPAFEAPAPPPVEAAPEPPPAFEAPSPPPPVAFEPPPAPPVEAAPEPPVAFEAPPEPAAPVVDPMFAPRPDPAAPAAPDQGWGVAEAPSFAPDGALVPAEAVPAADVAPPPAPFGAVQEAPPAAEPSTETEVSATPAPDNIAAEFAAAAEPPPPPEPPLEAAESLAPVIPINVDGLWVAGRGRPSGGAKAPKEKGGFKGLGRKRSENAAGLEVVGAAEVAAEVAAAPEVPVASPAEEAKPKRVFGKEIRFGRKKKKESEAAAEAGPEGGFPAVAPVPVPVPPAAPASDGGFGAVAPPPPPSGFSPAPQTTGGPDAGFGTDAGFGGGQAGFGTAPAPAPSGWQEQAPGKKKRGLRLPSSSGKFGRPMLIVLVVVALLVAALAYMFIGRGGGASQPAYALDFAAGQTYNYKMTMALNGQMTLSGRTVPLEETMSATMTWNVQSVDAGGVATIDVQLADPHITMNGETLPVGELPESASHYTMRVAKDGSILSGGGMGALSGGTSSAAGEVPGTDQLTPLLPGHDVNPGDTWDKAYNSELPYGMGHVHFVTHSTYVKNEDVNGVTTSVIASKMSMPLHMRVDLVKMMNQMGESTTGLPAGSHPVIVYGGHVVGTTTGWFDPSSRELLKTSVEAQFRMKMVFHGLPPGTLPGGSTMLFHGGILVNLQKV